MMTKFLSFALAAALCAPAFAQKMGSTNADAPTVKQTVVAGEAKISLDYTSITWASGKTMARIMDKEGGARMRTRLNDSATDAPLGTLSTSVDLMCGDLHIPAGEYKLFFTITDELAWQLNFQGKDKTHTMKLPLSDSEHESKRLMMCLYAGEEAGAGVYVAFGKHSGMLDLKPHAKK
ncbi:MAG: DUF2911 domain-containing protein [Planctomycetes bacterium]|nr:DUF2911 domain-containing protein [Planctomycetota bacterium]